MIPTIIGKKTDQTQSFLENGQRIPVTEIAVLENVVLQVKTQEKDFYTAVQLGTGVKKKPTKAQLGHVKKTGRKVAPLQIKEVRVNAAEGDLPNAGDVVALDEVFKPGDIVQVTGTSKGKGFAGTVKRHNFRGGPKTHGQSDRHRAPGAIGQGTTPGRVYKGKRMAGRMGTETVTVKNLTIVDVDPKEGKLFVSGLVPGHKNAWVYITRVGERKKFVPLLEVFRSSQEALATDATPVVTPDEAVVTPDETVKEPAETVEAPGEAGDDETKEVKSNAGEGELKTPDAEEKEQMREAAEENVEAEQKADAAAKGDAAEKASDDQSKIDVATQEEKKEEKKEDAS